MINRGFFERTGVFSSTLFDKTSREFKKNAGDGFIFTYRENKIIYACILTRWAKHTGLSMKTACISVSNVT